MVDINHMEIILNFCSPGKTIEIPYNPFVKIKDYFYSNGTFLLLQIRKTKLVFLNFYTL